MRKARNVWRIRQTCWKTAGSAVGVLAAGALLLGPAGPASAQMAGAKTTLTFTGALRGTLQIIPADDCSGAGAGGVQLADIAGKLGGSSGNQWSITIYTPHNGKYTYVKHPKGGLENFSFVVETRGKSEVKSWADTGGSLTNNAGVGTANLVLTGRTGGAQGTVHVKGGWNCPVSN